MRVKSSHPFGRARTGLSLLLGVSSLALASVSLLGAAPALGAPVLSPWWHVDSSSIPTHLVPGEKGEIEVTATNLGDAPVEYTLSPSISFPTIVERLPVGLTLTAISGHYEEHGASYGEAECEPVSSQEGTCKIVGAVAPYNPVLIRMSVEASKEAVSGESEVSISGGNGPSMTRKLPVDISASPVTYGVENYEVVPENEGGSVDTQAGSHPFQLTFQFAFDRVVKPPLEEALVNEPLTETPALTRNVHTVLPPGLIGNPQVLPQCPVGSFTRSECESKTAIGVASVSYTEPLAEAHGRERSPIYNVTPSVGEPARFGFILHTPAGNVPETIDTSVRTGGGYNVIAGTTELSETVSILGAELTFWGVPGEPQHDGSRGECMREGGSCPLTEHNPSPFLSLPTSCSTQPQSELELESWPVEHAGGPETTEKASETYTFANRDGVPYSFDGCNGLSFEPSIKVASDGEAASTPTGLKVDVHIPQEITLNPTGDAESDVKKITVTLPEGVQLSPAGADGLQACSEAQIGYEGENAQGEQKFADAQPSCPNAAKVATVTIHTPLLPNALTGEVYLAAPQNYQSGPQENPFKSLVALYLVAEDPVSGVLVKLAGRVEPSSSGQLTATFESPQLPFEDAELEFFGTDRAPLSTPALCGTYTTGASFEPWSGNPSIGGSSSFKITTGPDETGLAGCSSPRPFAPGFQSGVTNLQAGAFTPFTLTMTRPDQDQTLGRIEMTMPPGLLGTLSNVKLCGEAQANAGTCGPESLIGETVVSAGLGGDPFTVTGGKVYITTAYGGGAYGLSIVNPAQAGPFVLEEGRPVIVRAAIFVDPHTAALRIVSNPLPTILDGIPLQIQHVNVNIDREKFTFNPTNCSKTQIGATLTSTEGATAPGATSFQVTNCATLAFKPKFTASTAGGASRKYGASLKVKLTYPDGPYDANIKAVKVDLPKQLPSRLTTLQKACLAKVFEANPANCPKESRVGYAKAITPVIPVPLEGPAYFVSHGGEAFPSLIVVLQGYGTTVDLVGTTNISKAGITSSTFKSVPDVPVGSFELTIPEGKYSALAANLPGKARDSFCGQTLAMPTAFVAQNGQEIHESTPISVSGCAKKAVKKKKAKKSKKGVKKK